mmetsp:Transcript_34915/g.76383  ORF Transcript_34915/g.76383 Transcript_34915/m.76383 type:complete len:237 (-) Transcript_34915:1034-1744(-)
MERINVDLPLATSPMRPTFKLGCSIEVDVRPRPSFVALAYTSLASLAEVVVPDLTAVSTPSSQESFARVTADSRNDKARTASLDAAFVVNVYLPAPAIETLKGSHPLGGCNSMQWSSEDVTREISQTFGEASRAKRLAIALCPPRVASTQCTTGLDSRRCSSWHRASRTRTKRCHRPLPTFSTSLRSSDKRRCCSASLSAPSGRFPMVSRRKWDAAWHGRTSSVPSLPTCDKSDLR